MSSIYLNLLLLAIVAVNLLVGCVTPFTPTQSFVGPAIEPHKQTTIVNPTSTLGTEYPINWPIEIRYPAEFILLNAKSKILVDSTKIGFAAELQYLDKLNNSADRISSFLKDKGWLLVNRTEITSNELLLIFEDSTSNNQGVFVFKTDDENTDITLINALIVYR